MKLLSGKVPQNNVITGYKAHALFLTVYLSNVADPKLCANVLNKIPGFIDEINQDLADSPAEIIYGIGFSETYYKKLGGSSSESFKLKERIGEMGILPYTGGDILLHAKCDKKGKLFELCRLLMSNFPEGCVDDFEDIYGFSFRFFRDLSGFIDGLANPTLQADIINHAVNTKTSGSYAIAQKWIHDLTYLDKVPVGIQEQWMGREKSNGNELPQKSITSHVARMRGGNRYKQSPKFRMYRQSMAYGTLSGGAGLFFIGYSNTTDAINFMLDQMTGINDGYSDDIMRFTRAVTGNIYYFPNAQELDRLIS